MPAISISDAPSNACVGALQAALASSGGPTDLFSNQVPEFPKPFEIVDGRIAGGRLTEASQVWKGSWSGEKPPPDLIRRWLNAPYVSAAGCLADAHIPQRQLSDIPGWQAREGNQPQLRWTYEVSRPVFDTTSTYALTYYSAIGKDRRRPDWPCLCGHGGFVLLKSDGAGWIITGQLGLWNS
jgi:hypothetical protein